MKIVRKLPLSIQESINQIVESASENQSRIVSLNFAMGDLLNQTVKDLGLKANEVGDIFEAESGLSSDVYQTNARIARRMPLHNRPKNLPWGIIKYVMADISPRRLNVSIQEFCDAAVKALNEIEERDLKLIDLKEKDGDYEVGEALIRKYHHS